MARGPDHLPLTPRTKEQQLAARADAVAKMQAMLEKGPMTAGALFNACEGLRATLKGYLNYMHKTLRTVRPSGKKDGPWILWELGADPALPTPDEVLDEYFAPKRGIGPARQLGMRRDPLIAALFGSAAGAMA
ncbi:hypothetical protein [uncultured Massilia sp.]|uniref:hypothetical protein n=1 Tax=uncultured Massilia sp. TaxID=169973 RepID=UPI002586A7F0|nr:hypothetical protein [uncultured Massilia sp.]